MADKPVLVLREYGYLVKVAGKAGEEADYGIPASVTVGGKTHIAYVTLDDDGNPETCLEGLVYCGYVVEPEIVDEHESDEEKAAVVVGEDDKDDDDEDEDDDDDDDDDETGKGDKD